jgi:hypothetical protein
MIFDEWRVKGNLMEAAGMRNQVTRRRISSTFPTPRDYEGVILWKQLDSSNDAIP